MKTTKKAGASLKRARVVFRKPSHAAKAGLNVQLTLEERDAIDAAKRRLSGCITLLERLTDPEDFYALDASDEVALGVLLGESVMGQLRKRGKVWWVR